MVDVTATSKDGSKRSLPGFLAVEYAIPPGCAAGYMPEMNVLVGIKDYSEQSDQPLMKNLKVTITRSKQPAADPSNAVTARAPEPTVAAQ